MDLIVMPYSYYSFLSLEKEGNYVLAKNAYMYKQR